MRMPEPTIVITPGDLNGVGPEILLRSFPSLPGNWFVVSDADALEEAARLLRIPVRIRAMSAPHDIRPGCVNVLPPPAPLGVAAIDPGRISADAGDRAWHAIRAATELVLSGEAHAMVTLPVSKEAVQIRHPGFTGHTELIAEICGRTEYTMMLAGDRLTVTHVSTHVSMAEAIRAVTLPRVLRVIELTHDALAPTLGTPRIAVAGLNAHAGENGLFGREEIDSIRPAIESARLQSIDASGPYPPDTVFLRASRGEFDAVVCMYHDQGHIPLKLLDFDGGVNVTLGLPVIRTSVDHGTAFDIAYRGVASAESFMRAYKMAGKMLHA